MSCWTHYRRGGLKVYYLVTPQLYHEAHKDERAISLAATLINFISTFCSVSEEVKDVISHDNNLLYPYMNKFLNTVKGALSGGRMTHLIETPLEEMTAWLNCLPVEHKVDHGYYFLRDLIGKISSYALFGKSHNPIFPEGSTSTMYPGYNEEGKYNWILRSMWKYNRQFAFLDDRWRYILIQPYLFYSREVVRWALRKYYGGKYDRNKEEAPLAYARATLHRDAGFDDRSIGHLEITMIQGATANNAANLWWFLMHIFSRPELAARLRAEVGPLFERSELNGQKIDTLNVAQLMSKTPLLFNCWNESMRLVNNVMTGMIVQKDILVSDGERDWLLKKDNVAMVCTGPMHRSKKIWGEDADEFRPERFTGITPMYAAGASLTSGTVGAEMAKEKKAMTPQQRLQRMAFMPFNGGRHLCPGRFFAVYPSLAFAAALLMGFDVTDGRGQQLKVPPIDEYKYFDAKVWQYVGEGQVAPSYRQELRLRRKEGMRDVKFRFVMGKDEKSDAYLGDTNQVGDDE